MNTKDYNFEICQRLLTLTEMYPQMSFGKILTYFGVIQLDGKVLKDPYYDTSKDILDRMQETMKERV